MPASMAEVEEQLERAISAADALGLDVTDARAAATRMAERGGYPTDLYVLALAGGTGVGKSSLLNAIAGHEVSPAGGRRPTTASPVAWLPESHREQAVPLLEWLGGAEVRTHTADGPAVAVVDLPDLDSIEPTHAARVDAVLPRVDAVLWVTDPEKYDDAVLHDGYLRRWLPRLARQAIVINKVDRLDGQDARLVAEDLRQRLVAEALPAVPLLCVSALRDVGPVTTWLAQGASAKEVVSARLRQSAAKAAGDLAAAAGVDQPHVPGPLVPQDARARALTEACQAILGIVDLDGLRAQASAATRARARSVGGSPVSVARSLLERGSGATERRADPEGYLRRWRERGSLDRAVGRIRQPLLETLATLPPLVRPALVASVDPGVLSGRLATEIDGVVTGPRARFEVPDSRLWPLLGLGQLAATASIVVGLVWLLTLWVAGASIPTPTFEVPLLGAMPAPALLILLGLLGWFVLGRLLRWHADRLAGGWADELGEAIRVQVAEVLAQTVDESLADHDAARRALWAAAQATIGGPSDEG